MPDRARAQAVADALAARKDLAARSASRSKEPPGARSSVTLERGPVLDTRTLAQIPELRAWRSGRAAPACWSAARRHRSTTCASRAARDNRVIIPLTLLVVFIILAVLLRSLLAPLLLVGR